MKALVISKAFVNAMYRRKLRELEALGVDVVAVTPPEWIEGGVEQALERGDGENYDVRVLPIRFNGHFHIHYYSHLWKLIREVRPDIVHVDEEPYNLSTFHGVLGARRAEVASLFFTWQNLARSYPPPFRDMERAVYRWASLGIAGSDEAAHVLRSKGYAGPTAVIPQFGVDPCFFSPEAKESGPFTVGFFNRLIPGKAPLLALDAFARLPADTCLSIVGDGPLRPHVTSAVERLGLRGRVSIRPRVPSSEMPQLLRSLDALILPSVATASWKEQFGRVLIEAMACGIPVVGSTSGEIPHVIGDAGLVVEEGSVDALTDSLVRLRADTDLREELSRRGRQRVLERYTHSRIAQMTLDAYREALHRA